MTFLIYRNESNKIIKYSKVNFTGDDLEERIKSFNSKGSDKAEIVTSDDFKSLIELAEEQKKIRLSDIKSIQESFDNLQTEIYNLTESLT